MESRERVRRAVTFTHPDRTPIDLWTLPAAWQRHGDRLRELLRRYPIDFGPSGHRIVWEDEAQYRPGEWTDPWGVGWRNEYPGIFAQPKHHPLADYAKLDHYRPPFHLLGVGYKDVDATIRQHRDKFIVGGFIRLFERLQWLRGMSALLIDLAEDNPQAYRLRDMVHDFNMADLRHALQHDFDAISFSDDWGSQNQLLVSPAIWRRFFAPCYREMFEETKRAGKFVFFHSDGYILEIIEDLISLGVDALNSQVWCMGVEELGKRFAGRICFWGELDRQHTLPYGTPDDVRQAAWKMKQCLETPAGGLIGQGEAGADVPLANIEAMLTAWR